MLVDYCNVYLLMWVRIDNCDECVIESVIAIYYG